MKPFEIALFKHFLEGKGMVTVFINMYRKNHLKTNPISIEEFLVETEPQDVCMKAFRFFVNSNYGYDYWERMSNLWLDFLESNKDNYSSCEWYKLNGMSKILRTNWDAAKHWKEESRRVTALRFGIDLSLLGIDEKDGVEEPTKMSEEYLREKTEKEIGGALSQIDESPSTQPNKKIDIFGEFEIMSIRPKSHDKHRLRDNEMSVNTRNNKGRLTFNMKYTEEIVESCLDRATLMCNKKGDVVLCINKTDFNGATVSIPKKNTAIINATVTSGVLVKKICALLNIKNEYEIILATKVEKTNDYIAFLLTNPNN